MVLDFVGGEAVAVAYGCGEGAADFRFTTDGDAARLIRRRCGDVRHLARRVFVVSGVVLIDCSYADFMPGIIFGERIGAAVGLVDGLPVAHPLVLDFVSGNAVAVGYGRGEFAAQFGFARDADTARMVSGIGGIRPGVVGNGVTFGGS